MGSSIDSAGNTTACRTGADAHRNGATVAAREFDVYGREELLEVAGESVRQDALWEIVGGWQPDYVHREIEALLWPEPYVGGDGPGRSQRGSR